MTDRPAVAMLALVLRSLGVEARHRFPRFDAPSFTVRAWRMLAACDLAALRPVEVDDYGTARSRCGTSPTRQVTSDSSRGSDREFGKSDGDHRGPPGLGERAGVGDAGNAPGAMEVVERVPGSHFDARPLDPIDRAGHNPTAGANDAPPFFQQHRRRKMLRPPASLAARVPHAAMTSQPPHRSHLHGRAAVALPVRRTSPGGRRYLTNRSITVQPPPSAPSETYR